ncbi:MAG: FliG C-terminal domain-containing protein [Polyangiaceae bacterium]|nr:FliG C-terminal domain-containing protein [Polyangiaceae bacterium]
MAELTGPEKAVLMLLSMDESTAVPVVAELDATDIKKLRDVALLMREVPASSLDRVYQEFIARTQQAVAVPKGGERYLRKITTRALGEAKTNELFHEGATSAMERLSSADPTQLGSILEREHPQLVAALMSQMSTDRAALLLQALPEEQRSVVLERLSTMTEIPAGLLEEVAAALSTELPTGGTEAAISVDGISRSAALVRKLGRELGEALLENMDQGNSALAAEIRRSMYSFEDLKVIDKKAMRDLLKEIATDRLALALKTASEELKIHFLSAMSKRAAEMMREDMELLGGVRLSDVEAAQREIVETALRLESEGVLSLDTGGEQIV